ncbi:MAG: acyl-CoA carboxylase subunit epsilon [Flavobacterium sp.]|nr:acyl-CoA carboxylase subunit epsilon [Aeromicrobium sp.]
MLRVVKGDLTPEELAALVAVIAVRNAAAQTAAAINAAPPSQWGHPSRLAREPHHPGPDLWHRSTFGG